MFSTHTIDAFNNSKSTILLLLEDKHNIFKVISKTKRFINSCGIFKALQYVSNTKKHLWRSRKSLLSMEKASQQQMCFVLCRKTTVVVDMLLFVYSKVKYLNYTKSSSVTQTFDFYIYEASLWLSSSSECSSLIPSCIQHIHNPS